MNDFGAVIISAGLSSRMGSFKPLLPLGDNTVIGHLLSTFREAGAVQTVVVTGFRADELEAHIRADDVFCVRNERYAETQMFDSASLGFREIYGKCRRFFFTPVDIPLFTVQTLNRLLLSDAPVVYPTFNGKKGHPVLISADIIPDLLKRGETGGLRGALSSFDAEAEKIEVNDVGILRDADTPAEFEILKEIYNNRRG